MLIKAEYTAPFPSQTLLVLVCEDCNYLSKLFNRQKLYFH